MGKKIILSILIPLLVIAAFIYYNNSYSEFQPLIFKNDIYEKIDTDSTFHGNLKIVLDYHKVNYKINSSGETEIKRKIKADKELVFNYTTKALDTVWLNAHKFK